MISQTSRFFRFHSRSSDFIVFANDDDDEVHIIISDLAHGVLLTEITCCEILHAGA